MIDLSLSSFTQTKTRVDNLFLLFLFSKSWIEQNVILVKANEYHSNVLKTFSHILF